MMIIPASLLLQRVPDMAAILLPIRPTIQTVVQVQIPEAAVTTTVEAEAMQGTLSGRHSLIPVIAAAATVQASRPAPIVPPVLEVQAQEAAVEAQTHRQENSNSKSIQPIQYGCFYVQSHSFVFAELFTAIKCSV